MTRNGWSLLAVSVATYLVGVWLGHLELSMLGAAGVLLVLLALLSAVGRVSLAAERRVVPERATAGERAEGQLTLTNQGSRRTRALLGVEAIARVGAGAAAGSASSAGNAAGGGGRAALGDGVEVAVGRLAPQRAQTVPYTLPTDRRAVLEVGPLVITRGDPFGLVQRRTRHGEPIRFWVHPRLHPVGPLPVGQQRDLEGPTTESARGEAVFHSLREYVVGDDLRRVHWKATAHRGSLMVREHADPTQPDATVVLDDRGAALGDEPFDLAVEAAASVAVAARRAGFPVRLLSASGTVRTPALVEDTSLLDLLAGVEQQADDDLAGITRGLLAGPGGRALVAVTGCPTPADLTLWATAGRRYGLVVVIAVFGPGEDPAGMLPPAPAGVTVLPVRSGDELVAGWGSLR